MTLYRCCRLLCSFGFAIGSFALAVSSWAATIVDRQARPLNEIMIVVDSASGAWPDPATIIARVRENDAAIRTRLQAPIAARFLQPARVRPGVLAQLAANSRLKLLQQVIVVTYADRLAADRAEAMLLDDPGILLLERSMAMRFATGGPNDPLLVHNTDSTKYQWAAERLQLIPAWDKVRGTAYAAVLDNGIQIHGLSGNPGIHPDLSANYRPQFSSNFGKFNGTPSNNGTPNSLTGYPNSASNLDEEPYTLDGYPNIAGHGSHTAGIIAAQAGNSIGVAGVCQSCSLMVGRISSGEDGHPEAGVDAAAAAVDAGIGWMTNAGAQVINNSFSSIDPEEMGCEMGNYPITCATFDAALELDVAIVASAGNRQLPVLEFPASYAGVIGVGGVQYDANGAAFWEGSSGFGSNAGFGRPDYLVAPAKDVISTAYTGTDWRADFLYCGDNFPAGFAPGYGVCTGTSMAAPHVSGIVALIRSAYPTASLALVKNILTTNTTPCVEAGTSNIDSTGRCGAGIPDASRAVTAALGGEQVINRLTPLFSFYSAQAEDHFYTVVPQMGNAALWGTLFPTREDGADGFAAIGTTISGYPAFPGPACEFSPCPNRTAKALVSVFTTFRNPIPGGPELVPLYR